MKRAILIALTVTLLPTAAWGWDNRDYYDQERNSQLKRIADEAQYANEYKVYQEEKQEYEENTPEFMKPFNAHYFFDPQPPERK